MLYVIWVISLPARLTCGIFVYYKWLEVVLLHVNTSLVWQLFLSYWILPPLTSELLNKNRPELSFGSPAKNTHEPEI